MPVPSTPARTGVINLPLRYSKDGIPYPLDRETYDKPIELLRKAIFGTKLGIREKNEAVRKLNRLVRL
ncbi:hypothetical protein ES708_05821 [subsurface metagenome]